MVFILVCTFVVLNLFIAVVVRAMEDDDVQQTETIAAAVRQAQRDSDAALLKEIAALRTEIRALRDARPPTEPETHSEEPVSRQP